MLAVAELAPHVGLRSACRAFALNRGFVYRDRAGHPVTAARRVPRARPRPPLALSIAEQDVLLGLLDSERFTDVAPAAVFATLLDEGRYHGSIRTMYRLLAADNQTASADVSEPTRLTPSPSSWRSGPTKCGPGISPS
jgi:putative transposase